MLRDGQELENMAMEEVFEECLRGKMVNFQATYRYAVKCGFYHCNRPSSGVKKQMMRAASRMSYPDNVGERRLARSRCRISEQREAADRDVDRPSKPRIVNT